MIRLPTYARNNCAKASSLCSGLDDVDVLAPDGLVDLDHRLPVRLVVHAAAPQADVEVPERNRRRQFQLPYLNQIGTVSILVSYVFKL